MYSTQAADSHNVRFLSVSWITGAAPRGERAWREGAARIGRRGGGGLLGAWFC